MYQINEIIGIRIHIRGIVQGVGFRPFVYNLALRQHLKGWVKNTSAGVDIEISGSKLAIDQFLAALKAEIPPLAHIDQLDWSTVKPGEYSDFKIIHSESIPNAFQPISPDMSICQDCINELFDPNDRRFLYPFINCTNCGPRFTIIQDIPYDRPNTTMAGFTMCNQCEAEYDNPFDRRFHAQPIACPDCGPSVWLEQSSGFEIPDIFTQAVTYTNNLAIYLAQFLLSRGKILAIKGLGGFHLACDASNHDAVKELRERKLRVDKPFALMMADLSEIKKQCLLNPEESYLLETQERPIVILMRNKHSSISEAVTPNQDTIGVMLPYTPLHYLLFYDHYRDIIPTNHRIERFSPPKSLVMTSGNLSEEPIAFDNDDARRTLPKLADAFLMHDRPIFNRCDDSVVRFFAMPGNTKSGSGDYRQIENRKSIFPIRRSRGFAPYPIHLPEKVLPIFAAGAELKNTFCFTRENYAFTSQHIGDMENYDTLQSFEASVDYFERLFRIKPVAIAYDLHPDYLASRYALNRAESDGLTAIGVQHHHAHIAACMAENQLPLESKVIGVALDGTGYGDDGQIWGGEFLLASYRSYRRYIHLSYTPLPGGDAAIRRPARIALAYLWNAGLEWNDALPPVKSLSAEERSVIRSQLEKRINSPYTSSMGRLFDAVASIIGLRQEINYEAQAAIELEAIIDHNVEDSYPIMNTNLDSTDRGTDGIQIDTNTIIKAVVTDYRNNVRPSIISARFHNTIAKIVFDVCNLINKDTGLKKIVLSGGVWQNQSLLKTTLDLLTKSDYSVYIHHIVPTNDGGLSLGQAIIAHQTISQSKNLSGGIF
jgi:hydrogenase maturation protein HypF